MEQDIINCVEALSKGGIIIYPTDTIWGIGCDATNIAAIKKLHAIKKSSSEKSMLILCSGFEEIEHYVEKIPEIAIQLIENASKPVTVIYPNARNLPDILLADDKSIGIRIPKNDFCLKLIRAFGKPIVSTSANFSGEASPKSSRDISKTLIQQVDYCVSEEIQSGINLATASQLVKITEEGKIIVLRA